MRETTLKVTEKDMKVTKLLADAAWEIKNGFSKEWPSGKILMCWYHAAVKIRKRVEIEFSKEEGEKVMSDVYNLQLSQSPEIFEKAKNLFMTKYDSSPSFSDYFNKEWCEKNPNWFEGASSLTLPSTQCGQESTHGKIKMTFMGFERVSMNEMKNLNADIVRNFSLDLKNVKPFAHTAKISDKELEKAYKFSKKNKKVIEDSNEEEEVWWISAQEKAPVKTKQVRAVKEMKWSTFDEFSAINFAAHKIVLHKESKEISCTCRRFMKDFKCVHSVGFAVMKKIIKVPQAVKNLVKIPLPLSTKRGPGRPKKMTKALLK